MDWLSYVVIVGAVMALIGAVWLEIGRSRGKVYIHAKWSNIKEWEPGLKLGYIGIVIFIVCLFVKAQIKG